MTLVSLGPAGLRVEGVDLVDVARRYGTPCYVYSRAALEAAYRAYTETLQHHGLLHRAQVCYAVKANSNLAVLNIFARMGAGFDIVSGGELARVLAAGGDPARIVFSGVGKKPAEMAAALKAGIHCFNIESASELERLNQVAGQLGHLAAVSFRVNPDVDPKTHPYISTGLKSSKFGIAYVQARDLYRHAATLSHVRIVGIDCHIGSQLLDPSPAAEATTKLLDLVDQLAGDGIVIEHIDVGGGMGITYRDDEAAPSAFEYLAPMLEILRARPEKLVFEPGRSLVGNAGLLLTQVDVLKHGADKNFAVVDAAMNDLMRPALYDAWHDIVKVTDSPVGAGDTPSVAHNYEIVGPVCESGDWLAHDRSLALVEGDLLAIMSAGAYGMTMASNYNTRARAAEVMVDGDQSSVVRQREDPTQLFALESVLN
jgi:diaminopimelate decarboxylase